jgi:hypothetical protein
VRDSLQLGALVPDAWGRHGAGPNECGPAVDGSIYRVFWWGRKAPILNKLDSASHHI